MHLGMAGGIEGAVLGMISAVRMYLGIRNTDGPRERAFVITAAIRSIIVVILFLGLMSILPVVYQWVVCVLCAAVFAFGIYVWSQAQKRIRAEESLYGNSMRRTSRQNAAPTEWKN